ncbi:MAG: rRNA pseudouridine synthase [Treponema sp.]|nr:rRNA pseudouridine synthase [Treponema sp.]
MNLSGKPNPQSSLRLQVYLAHAGVASRRSSEAIILAGRVSVNGETVTVLGEKVDPSRDQVLLDGRPLALEKRRFYLVLNKPPGYICSSFDPQNRPLALDLLPGDIGERLFSVGRLDFRSSGLIIFTNDGDFTARVSHPSAEIEKEYLVEASGSIPDEALEAFSKGIEVEGIFYKALEVERTSWRSLRIVLIEGKNREIRRVFSHFHLHPEKLCRIRIGPVLLADLAEGFSRPLTEKELKELGKGAAVW